MKFKGNYYYKGPLGRITWLGRAEVYAPNKSTATSLFLDSMPRNANGVAVRKA